MSDEDKKRFIEAVTGAGGKIDSKAAAALIAAAASGGDPEIANKVEYYNLELLVEFFRKKQRVAQKNMTYTTYHSKSIIFF